MVSKKNLGEKAGNFFKVLQSSDVDISRFGKFFTTDINHLRSHAKVLLAIQSGFSVMGSHKNAAAKAANFEKEKLSPKQIALSDLPPALVSELNAMSQGQLGDGASSSGSATDAPGLKK